MKWQLINQFLSKTTSMFVLKSKVLIWRHDTLSRNIYIHTTKLRRKQFVPAKKKLQCRKKLCPFLTRHDFCINTCYKSLLHGRYWYCSSWTAQMQFAADFKLNYGTIPILRQQKDWVGGVRKCPFLLTFSAAFMLI